LRQICRTFEKLGITDKLDACQRHPNLKVYNLAVDLVKKYFDGEEEDDDLMTDNRREN